MSCKSLRLPEPTAVYVARRVVEWYFVWGDNHPDWGDPLTAIKRGMNEDLSKMSLIIKEYNKYQDIWCKGKNKVCL